MAPIAPPGYAPGDSYWWPYGFSWSFVASANP